MFLTPIEKPTTLKARIAYWLTRRRFGKVITPLKVTYARVPESLPLAQAIHRFSEKGIRLDPALALLLQVHVARLNNCSFCIDIGHALAQHQGISLKKFAALPDYPTDPQFTDAERAALDFATEVTRNKHVQPQTFDRLRAHYTERDIVEMAFLNAIEHFYNVLNISMGIESDGLCPIPVKNPRPATLQSIPKAG